MSNSENTPIATITVTVSMEHRAGEGLVPMRGPIRASVTAANVPTQYFDSMALVGIKALMGIDAKIIHETTPAE